MKINNPKNMIPFDNKDVFFLNNSEFSNEYIISSNNRNIEPTFFEKKILNKYFLTEIGFGLDKNINFNSNLILSYLDFARFYLDNN